ncbi:hypothetical protein EB796_014493 [Bugula neritina]|uniref:Uncharacterized protein n=1 Tax=Bugula neritina TaxID=10212 RepID=A0A7J7JMW7_BUGNE|nr:hypothetical protein EB796_014493 [Bugula neritina]
MGWYDTTVGSLCAVYVKEKCLMSPIVSAKTVRILHAGTLAQAAKLYSDIQFIYVLRDPRAYAGVTRFYSNGSTRGPS